MKVSKYNFFYPFDDNNNQVLTYNALHGTLALMDQDKYDKFLQFANNNTPINDDDFEKDLFKGGIVTNDQVDELSLLRLQMLQSRYNSHHMGLTIAVTEDCNFRCTYCYEQNSIQPKKMTTEVQGDIVQLVENRIEALSNLSITWYGGEPLMAMDTIKNLSDKIVELCETHNITYNAFIVTNGYLLNADYASKLANLKVTGAQVTLDGPEDIHNERRPLVGGKPTFDRIIKNLQEAIEHIPNINIRINTDKENEERVDEIFDVLKNHDLLGKVGVYLGFVEALNDSYVQYKCMTPESFSKTHYNFVKKNGIDIKTLYPRRFTNYCCADAINSYVIGADGYLYKCWNDIGMTENSVDKLPQKNTSGLDHNFKMYSDYMLYDPTTDEKCQDCSYLPICMGGCPNRRIEAIDNCTHTKYVLEDYLQECAKSILEERASQQS